MSTPEERLQQSGCRLPPAPKPFGVYRPYIDVQTQREDGSILCYISGHGPQLSNGSFIHGKVGFDITKEEAVHAAKQTAMSVLSTLRKKYGTLNAVKRILKSLVMVNSVSEFTEHITVANGYSEFMREIFGSDGVGVRSAVGMGSLPMNLPVEVELVVEFFDPNEQQPKKSETTTGPKPLLLYDSIVNGCGHFTSLGGSRLHPKALEAMQNISNHFVDLNELLENAGEQIKHLCKAPLGYMAHVTTGASAALSLSACACLARDEKKIDGYDTGIISMLPNIPTTAHTRKIILVDGGSDLRWIQSIELSGAKVMKVGTIKNPMNKLLLQEAIENYSEQIAAFYYFSGGSAGILPIDDVMKVVQRNQKRVAIPVVVDAAARLPPVSNLSSFVKDIGVDCVLFSGGKMLRGPQSSGFMIGKDWLIHAARASACPNEATVGRPMKTTKESIVGLVAALEQFVEDEGSYPETANRVARHLADKLLASRLEIQKYFDVALKSGENAGMNDVQPNVHELVFIDLKHLELEKNGRSVTNRSTSRPYGEGVNHGSPMKIFVNSPATYLADRLSKCSPRRIAVNTTASGLLINPIVMTEEEASYAANKIILEINRMAQELEGGSMNMHSLSSKL